MDSHRRASSSASVQIPAHKMEHVMELYFTCPLTGRGFMSENWRIQGKLQVREEPGGVRTLLGTVEVDCPVCGSTHAYSTEELVCPLSQVEK